MATEQPTDSDVSIEQRLMASLAPEVAPEAPESELPQPEAQLPDNDDGDEADEQPEQPESDLVEVQAEDGSAYKVPSALKDAFLRQADYTRKTQHAANLAQTAEDRLQFAEAREQFTAAVMGDVASLRAKQQRLKEFDSLDMGALYGSDPGTALRLRDQRDELRREIAAEEQAIGGKARHLQALTEQHHARQWELAVDGVKKAIGQYTPGEDAAMLKQVEVLGLTLKEVRGRYADPRILHAIYKAAKYDAIQSRKSGAVQTAQAAPPVVKPGAVTQTAAVSKDKALRARLKQSGDYKDAARLLLARGIL